MCLRRGRTEARQAGKASSYFFAETMCVALPKKISAVSPSVSAKVGWACIVRATSAARAPISIFLFSSI